MIRVSGIVKDRTFEVAFDESEEISSGFVSIIRVSLTQYDDGERSLSINCKGIGKTSKGKPDMRSKRPQYLSASYSEGRQLVLDAIGGCAPKEFEADFVEIAGIIREEIEEQKQQLSKDLDEILNN